MRLFEHWWMRVALYAVLVPVAAWCTYRVAYRYVGGPHPVDSEKDVAFIWGAAGAAGVTIALALVLVMVEAFRLLRSGD